MKRIFVRGVSRSGGTLMVTVLDAHPDVAMGYELYEHILAPEEGEGAPLPRMVADVEQSTRSRFRKIKDARLRTFAARVQRGGVSTERFLELLQAHAAAGGDLSTFEDRMGLVERIALDKARREGKTHWGCKIAKGLGETHELYDEAYFLFMLRDGRDVAASRKNVGEFNQTVEEVASGWRKQIERFRRFAARPGVRARFVRYERLTDDPEAELRGVLEFLGLPWDVRVMTHDEQDLTLYRNPTGHLSARQVDKPINTSSVGRWKRDLTADEVALFESLAGDELAAHGYEIAAPT